MAAALRSLAAERPNDPEPLRRLAGLDIAIGDPDGAVHSLRQALTIAPDRPDLMAPLGEILAPPSRRDGGARRAGGVSPSAPPRSRLGHGPLLSCAREDRGGRHSRLGLDQLCFSLPALPSRDLAGELCSPTSIQWSAPAPYRQPSRRNPPRNVDTAIRGMVEGLALRLQAHPDNPARLGAPSPRLSGIGRPKASRRRARSGPAPLCPATHRPRQARRRVVAAFLKDLPPPWPCCRSPERPPPFDGRGRRSADSRRWPPAWRFMASATPSPISTRPPRRWRRTSHRVKPFS